MVVFYERSHRIGSVLAPLGPQDDSSAPCLRPCVLKTAQITGQEDIFLRWHRCLTLAKSIFLVSWIPDGHFLRTQSQNRLRACTPGSSRRLIGAVLAPLCPQDGSDHWSGGYFPPLASLFDTCFVYFSRFLVPRWSFFTNAVTESDPCLHPWVLKAALSTSSEVSFPVFNEI